MLFYSFILYKTMTGKEAFQFLHDHMRGWMEHREASLIARYLVEDLTESFSYSEKELSEAELNKINSAAKRLLTHEPWQYISGRSDFYGLTFTVTPDVLIPRPETEELVYHSLSHARSSRASSVLDLCTGSGIIPVTLGKKHPFKRLYGLDVSMAALDVARSNAEKQGIHVEWILQDILNPTLWSDLPVADIVTANPPYVTQDEKSEMHPNVVLFEPHIALFVSDDALLFYRAITDIVQKTQNKGCFLMVEIHEKYGREVAALFWEKGFNQVSVLKDLQGKDRMVSGVK